MPKFFKNQFFHSFCQNFTCFPSIFPSFHPISSSKSLFFFLRLDFATLNLPTGGRSSVPLTPLNGHSHSLVPLISFYLIFFCFLFFLAYLLRIFINNLIFIKTFINKLKKFLLKVLTRGKRYDIVSMWESRCQKSHHFSLIKISLKHQTQ